MSPDNSPAPPATEARPPAAASRPGRSVIVLGAGMVGACSALHLARRGFQVLLVDRQPPGRETSYGNAGIIQREAVEPYAFPRDVRKLLGVAFKRGGDVNYHLAALPGLAPRLARYWQHSGPARYPAIAQAYTRLIEHATSEHQPLIDAAGAQDLVRREGYLHLFREGAALQAAVAAAQALQRSHGLRHAVLDSAALAAAEPALRQRLPGAIHWLDPWSVTDPGELVARYAAYFQRQGGRFEQAEATGLQASAAGWVLHTAQGRLEAEHCVIALGPWADSLLAPLGYRLPLFVKRGYHRHLSGGPAPKRPLYDIARGLVIAPMRQGVRITTGAEFAQRDAANSPWQLARAEAAARELLHLPQAVEPTPWRGARPCTVDMKPVIGPAPRHRGLWFNFGHAHQGFTLGPVSGRLLAELMSGEPPVVAPGPYLAQRFL